MKQSRQHGWLRQALAIMLALALTACGGGGGGGSAPPAAPTAKLNLSAAAVTFTAPVEGGANPASQIFTVTNGGDSGTTLSWSATESAAWLTVAPTSGSLAQNAAENVTLSVDITGLTEGTYTAPLTLSATGLASKTVSVSLTIGKALTVNPTPLAFTVTQGANPLDQTVTLANASNLAVSYTIASNQQWLTVTPNSGSLAAGGQSTVLTVSVNSQTLAANTYSGSLTLTSGTAGVTGLTIPVTLTVNAAAAAGQSVQVGGTAGIGQLSSLVAARAAIRKAATTPTVLADAKVTITVIKPDGSQTVTSTVTNAQGAYTAQINAVAGDTVTVTIEKQGYTTYIQTFTVDAASSQLTVSGNLAQAATLVAQASGGAFKAGGGTTNGYRFGLMRKPSGERATFASSSGIRAAATAGGVPELDISIPTSWAPDATALTAQLAAFNPNLPSERQMFPGEFVGAGGGTVAAGRASTTEYPLESVSFFQSVVTPNNGQPLAPTGATGASKAAAEPTVIYKYIPSEGCGSMQKYEDRDSTVAGVQVPLYTYNPNTGKWGYLGEGTLKTWNGTTYDTVDANTVKDGAGKLTGLACGVTDYYFEIVASEWYEWWNLDYPLLFAIPTTVCISGTVRDQLGAPIPGAFVEADGYATGGNSYFYGYTNNDGTFSFDITVGAASDAANYVYTAYNYMTWPPLAVDFTASVPAAPSTTACNNIGDITITDTATCAISGRMFEETATGAIPFAGTWVAAWNSDYSYYNWAETAADGTFSMKATCIDPITVWAWGQELTTTVDGNVIGAELSDNGTTVVLNDIRRTNAPPEIWTWAWPNPAKAGQPVDLEAWSWDYEGDYPLTTSWSISDGTTSNLEWFTWTPTAAGSYTATVIVTDSKGNAATQSFVIDVGEAGNSAPTIWWTWADPPVACGGAPTLYGDAYDADGDTIEFRWQQETAPGVWADLSGTWSYPDGAGGTATLAGSVFSTATYWYFDSFVPDAAPTGAVRLAVIDLPASGTAKEVYEAMTLPSGSGIDLYYAEAWPTNLIKGGTVDLYAYAWDNNAVTEASYTWNVVAPDSTTATTTQVDPGFNYWVTFVADQIGTYQVTLTVSGQCVAEPIVRTFTVTATAPASVNVTID